MSKFNGKNLSITVYGNSHDSEIGVTCNGYPKFKIDEDKLQEFLNRRKPSKSQFSTPRKESDTPCFFGLNNGFIDGEFTAKIYNLDTKSKDYSNLYGKPRPSHADYSWYLKDGELNFAGGGRFSGRLTAPFCIAGGIAKQYLEKSNIKICAYVSQIGNIKAKSYKNGLISYNELVSARDCGNFPSLDKKEEILNKIQQVKQDGDSVGGIIEVIVYNLNAGLGNDLFEGLEGKISSLIYSVPAVKGVEFGAGFELSTMQGSTANDALQYVNGSVEFLSNNSGGINGGISNGAPLLIRVCIKPTPSIFKEQKTVDLVKKENAVIKIEGRHDSCIVPRAVPCIESAVAIALLDEILGD